MSIKHREHYLNHLKLFSEPYDIQLINTVL